MSIPPHIPSWADVKIYSSAGVYAWTKPTWAKMIYYNIMPAGNGGGGGASRTSGQGGGGGGSGDGNALFGVNPAAFFPDTLYIRVGKGGTGGAAGNAATAAQDTQAHSYRTDSEFGGIALWQGQTGNVGGAGTTSAGGSGNSGNAGLNYSRVGNYGICLVHGSQVFGQGGGASATVALSTNNSNQVQHGGGGGAGVSSTGFAGRGGGYENQIVQLNNISQFNLSTRIIRGGHGASVTLKGNGLSTTRSNSNCTATVTFQTGETVIVALGLVSSVGTRTYTSTVTDGTHTYEAITSFVPHATGGQGGIQLYKADNVTSGTYNIIASVTEDSVLVTTNSIAWYRYDGLSSGSVLATATRAQDGTGVTTNGITCGPVSSTTTPCLLFAATNGQNGDDFDQRVEPGFTINRLIESPILYNQGLRITAGDSLISTTASVSAHFTVFDIFTYRTTAAVLIGVKTNQLEPKAGNGMDGDIYWLPDTIIPFMRGGGGGGSSHLTEGGDGGRGGPCSSGGGGGAGNPGGRGGNGGDGMCIIACW